MRAIGKVGFGSPGARLKFAGPPGLAKQDYERGRSGRRGAASPRWDVVAKRRTLRHPTWHTERAHSLADRQGSAREPSAHVRCPLRRRVAVRAAWDTSRAVSMSASVWLNMMWLRPMFSGISSTPRRTSSWR